MIQHASSDILTSIGESQFQTRKCYFWHAIENLQSTASKNLRILRQKVQNTVSREKDKVITTFCSINCEFLFMLLSTIMMQYL